MSSPTDTWIEQPNSPRRKMSANGRGSLVYTFLAAKNRGEILAEKNGHTTGKTKSFQGETFTFDDITVSNYEGGFDMVEITYVSQQGSGGFGSKDGRVHKKGDEEWTAAFTAEQHSLQDAIDLGMLESATDAPAGADLDTVLTWPIPKLIRRRWVKGEKSKKPLPTGAAEAVDLYNNYFDEMGASIGSGAWTFSCDDIQFDVDGMLLQVTQTYKFSGYYKVDGDWKVTIKKT